MSVSLDESLRKITEAKLNWAAKGQQSEDFTFKIVEGVDQAEGDLVLVGDDFVEDMPTISPSGLAELLAKGYIERYPSTDDKTYTLPADGIVKSIVDSNLNF
ncbi:hypothetical protein N9850_11025 [Granulosicoccus sp.]|nr:hypothetical protein [Granulosicoccus sp.]MDB4224296.1 hypothetical protein [Granulosicoccus sp.]